MPEAEEPTVVVFRVWKGKEGGVIALFPEIPASCGNPHHCSSFEHVGQHGAADYHGVVLRTRKAVPQEYRGLKAELEAEPYGYRLVVRERASCRHHRTRLSEHRRILNTSPPV